MNHFDLYFALFSATLSVFLTSTDNNLPRCILVECHIIIIIDIYSPTFVSPSLAPRLYPSLFIPVAFRKRACFIIHLQFLQQFREYFIWFRVEQFLQLVCHFSTYSSLYPKPNPPECRIQPRSIRWPTIRMENCMNNAVIRSVGGNLSEIHLHSIQFKYMHSYASVRYI